MTDPDDDARAELLGRLLSGAADRADPAVAKALERDPSLLRELAELQSLADDLDGEREPEPMPELPRDEPWPGADRRIHELVHTHLRGRGVPVGPSRRWWWLAAVAAAAAVIALVMLLRPGAELRVAPPDLQLAAEGDGKLWPNGTVTREELRTRLFAWDFGPAWSTDRYTLEIGGESFTGLSGSGWRAPSELIERLPKRFQWSVERQRSGLGPTTLRGYVSLD